MRYLIILLLALMLIPTLAACDTSGSITLTTPSAEVSDSPAVSPAPFETETTTVTPSPAAGSAEAVIIDFVSSQNTHNWSKFTGLWRKSAQSFLNDFFTYKDNAKNKNGYFAIESAELLSLTEIYDFKNEAETDTYYETDMYKDVRVFSVQADYHNSKDFWGYYEGRNYLELVLVKEDGAWKISQDYLMNDPEVGGDYVYVDHSRHADGKVHFKKKITGYYLATEWGDYAHIIIMTVDGKQMSLWDNTGLDRDEETDDLMLPFLQKMQITWTNHDSYIEEAGQVENQDAATDIKLLD